MSIFLDRFPKFWWLFVFTELILFRVTLREEGQILYLLCPLRVYATKTCMWSIKICARGAVSHIPMMSAASHSISRFRLISPQLKPTSAQLIVRVYWGRFYVIISWHGQFISSIKYIQHTQVFVLHTHTHRLRGGFEVCARQQLVVGREKFFEPNQNISDV
jgi:hypothetical protein